MSVPPSHKAGKTDLEGSQLLVEGALRLAVLLLQLAHLAANTFQASLSNLQVQFERTTCWHPSCLS